MTKRQKVWNFAARAGIDKKEARALLRQHHWDYWATLQAWEEAWEEARAEVALQLLNRIDWEKVANAICEGLKSLSEVAESSLKIMAKTFDGMQAAAQLQQIIKTTGSNGKEVTNENKR